MSVLNRSYFKQFYPEKQLSSMVIVSHEMHRVALYIHEEHILQYLNSFCLSLSFVTFSVLHYRFSLRYYLYWGNLVSQLQLFRYKTTRFFFHHHYLRRTYFVSERIISHHSHLCIVGSGQYTPLHTCISACHWSDQWFMTFYRKHHNAAAALAYICEKWV